MRTRVKVCCIADEAELELAVRAGADAVGLVGPMPSGPGPISLERIRILARRAPPAVATFLLSAETEAEGLASAARSTAVSTLQIVDHVGANEHRALRALLPGVKLVQVIHVEDARAIPLARELAGEVDGLLLDSGRPGAAVKELGGTGRTHDWAIARAIVEAVTVPVFLAGGLRPENVGDAIRTVRPYGVDLCSGVRSAGRLDAGRLAAFMEAVRAA